MVGKAEGGSWHSRSVGKVLDDVGIVQHCDTGGTIVAVIGPHGGEAIGCAVRQILVLDA